MPFLTNREVESYRLSVFESSNLNYSRSISLKLKPNGSNGSHTVNMQFPTAAPTDFVSIGNTFSTVKLDRAKYEDTVHMLQTESPVYFNAFETENGTVIRFAGLTTDPEFTGEGLTDADSQAA
ncbi:MAG: hypothetical protein AAGF58_00085 [Pseudomonadota bacterium]